MRQRKAFNRSIQIHGSASVQTNDCGNKKAAFQNEIMLVF